MPARETRDHVEARRSLHARSCVPASGWSCPARSASSTASSSPAASRPSCARPSPTSPGLLEGDGASLADVTKTTVFLRHLGADYATMNEVYVELFGDHRPARSAIGVAELPLGALVELEAWAHVGAG